MPMQEGPYFDELAVGQEFGSAPGVTLTSGLAAAHQAITGDRLALATDHDALPRGHRRRPARLAEPGLGRGHRAVHGGHPARQGQPVLPRAGLPPHTAARRHAADLDPGRRAEAEPAAGRPRADRPRGPADHHRGPGSGGRCWTSGAVPCCRCATTTGRPGTPMSWTRSGHRLPREPGESWSAAGGWTGSPGRRRARAWPGCGPGRAGRCRAATWSPARPSWPG